MAREDPGYRGEAWTETGQSDRSFWSPNRLVFQVEPGEAVHINQNPGSWWWVNGRPAFQGLRCAELTVPFTVMADERGRIELQIRPRGLAFGIGLHIVGAFLVALAWVLRPRPQADLACTVTGSTASPSRERAADRDPRPEQHKDRPCTSPTGRRTTRRSSVR